VPHEAAAHGDEAAELVPKSCARATASAASTSTVGSCAVQRIASTSRACGAPPASAGEPRSSASPAFAGAASTSESTGPWRVARSVRTTGAFPLTSIVSVHDSNFRGPLSVSYDDASSAQTRST